VEALVPPKADVLQAIESENGQKPLRYARVVLFEGIRSDYGMREYKVFTNSTTRSSKFAPLKKNFQVGPLPISSDATISPLTDMFNNRPGTVPFNARYHDKVWESSYAHVLDDLKAEIADVLQDLFSLNVSDFELHLTIPYSLDGAYARMWFQWSLKGRSSYLTSLPLWTQLDVSGRDPSRYHVRKIRYEKRTWKDVQSFKKDCEEGMFSSESMCPSKVD
jgi:hypothetical protein